MPGRHEMGAVAIWPPVQTAVLWEGDSRTVRLVVCERVRRDASRRPVRQEADAVARRRRRKLEWKHQLLGRAHEQARLADAPQLKGGRAVAVLDFDEAPGRPAEIEDAEVDAHPLRNGRDGQVSRQRVV